MLNRLSAGVINGGGPQFLPRESYITIGLRPTRTIAPDTSSAFPRNLSEIYADLLH